MTDHRKLADLVSVGPATIVDLELLGITRVTQLRGQDALEMYEQLQRVTGKRQDPCVMDVFSAAIAQAENPRLPKDKCQWFYWSKVRKGEIE